MPRKVPVHVEVAVHPSSNPADLIRKHLITYLNDNEPIFRYGSIEISSENALSTYIEHISVTQIGTARNKCESGIKFFLHLFYF